MKCQRCGAELLDTDTFCVKCGQKVGEPAKCPVCGEILREGTKFCHKCGAAVINEDTEPHDEEIPVTPQKTIDIPFDVIEKSIIMEAEQAVVKRDFSEAEARLERIKRGEITEHSDETNTDTDNRTQVREEENQEEKEEIPVPVVRERPSKVVEAVREGRIYEKPEEDSDREEDATRQTGTERRRVSRRRKNSSYENKHYEDTDYEDTGYEDTDYEDAGYEDTDYEDTGYEDPDYEEDDYEDEKESSGGFDLTKATMILGIIVLIIILIAGGIILKKKLNFDANDGDDAATEQQEGNNESDNGGNTGETTQEEVAGKLQIIKNVNMRDQPSTENSSILGVAKIGEVYEYYELVSDSWYHIRLSDGSDAYVYKEYVEALN